MQTVLTKEQEQWEQEANPVTEEIINEMCEHYNEEEENEVEKENEVEIKVIPCSLDFGELRDLGYDY